MEKIWCCEATLELPVLADSITAGMPRSNIVSMPVKIRMKGELPPSPDTIAKQVLHAWNRCYEVIPTRVIATYENFILWDNI